MEKKATKCTGRKWKTRRKEEEVVGEEGVGRGMVSEAVSMTTVNSCPVEMMAANDH